jgi:hypothetical protein
VWVWPKWPFDPLVKGSRFGTGRHRHSRLLSSRLKITALAAVAATAGKSEVVEVVSEVIGCD